MKKTTGVIWFLILISTYTALSQDVAITRAEFLAKMRASDQISKTTPYRTTSSVEKSQGWDGPWKPYSSFVTESIVPDRSRVFYKTGPHRQVVRIGKELYSLGASGLTTRIDGDVKGLITTPSAIPVFKEVAQYSIVATDSRGTTIKVVDKPTAASPANESRIFVYFFNEQGLLHKRESIVPNEGHWIRYVEEYEYDPTITIDHPNGVVTSNPK